MENTNCNIGQRIYDLRIERDIQQGELARAVHLHQSVLNRIEKGLRPARDDEIRRIALHFGVSAGYLLDLPTSINVNARSTDKEHTTELSISADDELTLIKKFRTLDARGQHAVMDTVEREYSYIATDIPKEA